MGLGDSLEKRRAVERQPHLCHCGVLTHFLLLGVFGRPRSNMGEGLPYIVWVRCYKIVGLLTLFAKMGLVDISAALCILSVYDY